MYMQSSYANVFVFFFFVGKYQVVEILGCIESIYKTLLKSTMLSSKLVKCLEVPQW